MPPEYSPTLGKAPTAIAEKGVRGNQGTVGPSHSWRGSWTERDLGSRGERIAATSRFAARSARASHSFEIVVCRAISLLASANGRARGAVAPRRRLASEGLVGRLRQALAARLAPRVLVQLADLVGSEREDMACWRGWV